MLHVNKGRDSVLNILNFNLSSSKHNFLIPLCLLAVGRWISVIKRDYDPSFFLSFQYRFNGKYLGSTQFYMLWDTSLKCLSCKITNGTRYLLEYYRNSCCMIVLGRV